MTIIHMELIKIIKNKIFYKYLIKNSFLLHVPVQQPCYDFIPIAIHTFIPKKTKWQFYRKTAIFLFLKKGQIFILKFPMHKTFRT